MFVLQFLPNCNDDIVATGAGDWNSHTYNITTGNRLSVCTCARGRVKRIAVANDTPSVYWSASEDGSIRHVKLFLVLYNSATKNYKYNYSNKKL